MNFGDRRPCASIERSRREAIGVGLRARRSILDVRCELLEKACGFEQLGELRPGGNVPRRLREVLAEGVERGADLTGVGEQPRQLVTELDPSLGRVGDGDLTLPEDKELGALALGAIEHLEPLGGERVGRILGEELLVDRDRLILIGELGGAEAEAAALTAIERQARAAEEEVDEALRRVVVEQAPEDVEREGGGLRRRGEAARRRRVAREPARLGRVEELLGERLAERAVADRIERHVDRLAERIEIAAARLRQPEQGNEQGAPGRSTLEGSERFEELDVVNVAHQRLLESALGLIEIAAILSIASDARGQRSDRARLGVVAPVDRCEALVDRRPVIGRGREARRLDREGVGRQEPERTPGRLEGCGDVALRVEEVRGLVEHPHRLGCVLGDGDPRLEHRDERSVVVILDRETHQSSDRGRDHRTLLRLGEIETEGQRLEAASGVGLAVVLLERELVASDGLGPIQGVLAMEVAEASPKIRGALRRRALAGLRFEEIDELVPLPGALEEAGERVRALVVATVPFSKRAPGSDRAGHVADRVLEEASDARAIGASGSTFAATGPLLEELDELFDPARGLERGGEPVAHAAVVGERERFPERVDRALGVTCVAKCDRPELGEGDPPRLGVGLELGEALEDVAALGREPGLSEESVELARRAEGRRRIGLGRAEHRAREADRLARVADVTIEDRRRLGEELGLERSEGAIGGGGEDVTEPLELAEPRAERRELGAARRRPPG